MAEIRDIFSHPATLVHIWSRKTGLATLNPREIGAKSEAATGQLGAPFLPFADDAQEFFADWRATLEHRLRVDDLPLGLHSQLAQNRGLIPRLALICSLANNGCGPVSVKALGQALAWAAYLESHAWRAYASVTVESAEAARAIR